MKRKSTLFFILLIAGVLALGLFFRLWHIEFGLPHSFYADEPEIAEPAIKNTYEFIDVIKNNNWYKLIPVSFVYGTFPTYVYTLKTMFLSKSLNLLGIPFDKTTLYIYMRIITSLISFLIAPFVGLLFYKIFKDKWGALLVTLLISLNWKLIVHAHYVNADILLTFLLILSFLFFYFAQKKGFDDRNTVLSAMFFGFAVGTKITALISLPLFLFVTLYRKDLKALLGFIFTTLLFFIISNPFSIIFFGDFSFRIFEMMFKEAGMVFDSVNYTATKYLFALNYMLTTPILVLSVYGLIKAYRTKANRLFHLFLAGNILVYVLFYSFQSRRVDRWLLPTLPIILVYASYGILVLRKEISFRLFLPIVLLIALFYIQNPLVLLFQFSKNTPKSSAYLWAKNNLPQKEGVPSYILVYTEEGLDPMHKLNGTDVNQVNVYTAENSQLFYPKDPLTYQYVIISSRPLDNYKKEEVAEKFPQYTQRWGAFETTITNESNFKLVKAFYTTRPNLIPLSDVLIYENIKYQNVYK